MQEIRLTLPIPPSVNASHRNVSIHKRIRTPATVEWMEIAKWEAVAEAKRVKWKISEGEKLVLYLWVYWPDGRRRDVHNLTKVAADALEGVLYHDDKWLLVRDVDFTVDRSKPRIEILIRRKEDDDIEQRNGHNISSTPCVEPSAKAGTTRKSVGRSGGDRRRSKSDPQLRKGDQ